MPPIRHLDHDDDHDDIGPFRPRGSRRATRHRGPAGDEAGSSAPAAPPRRRDDGRASFKCGACRAFIGPTVSGGRHRNHCPLCLVSRHVDERRPGDRASPCRALMSPVGTFFRPGGEQVVLHQCRGCGLERHNRIAADDNPIALLRLPLVPPRIGRRRVLVPAAPAEQDETAATG